MAYSVALADRHDEAPLRNLPLSGENPGFSYYNPSLLSNVTRIVSHTPPYNDTRAGLQRRFTTQSVSTVASLSSMAQPRRQAVELPAPDSSLSMLRTAQLLEKKQAEYEFLKHKHLQFQHEMELIALRAKREEEDMHRLRSDLGNYHAGAGHQSEPTTPPDYRETGFPSALSRPNRFSASGIMSPPGLINRPSRAGSQVTSPPVERARAYQALTSAHPSQSVPGSRRDSEDEDDQYKETFVAFNHRGAASRNRNSMPVTRRDLGVRVPADIDSTLGPVDTPGFLFGDDYMKSSGDDDPKSSSRPASGFLSMQKNGDNFPVLIRSDGEGRTPLSAASEALDLASSQAHDQEPDSSGWPSSFARPLSQSNLPTVATTDSSHVPQHFASSDQANLPKSATNRHSMGAKMTFTETLRPGLLSGPLHSAAASRLPTKLQTSFSTSSVPTVSSLAGNLATSASTFQPPAMATAEQRLHQHNVSLGRIPTSAINSNRQSRDLSGLEARLDVQNNAPSAMQSALHANAPSFGPAAASSMSSQSFVTSPTSNMNGRSFPAQPFMGNYVAQPQMQQLNEAMGGLSMAPPQQSQWNGTVSGYTQSQPYGGYNTFQQYGGARTVDSQARVIQQRRNQSDGDNARFANLALEALQGEIYGLCKDQYGCRYLQKKLEDRKPESIQMIFLETHQHMVELMTDPFGNYLCQKLLEFTNDEQRTVLINSAAPQMVDVALNQHGTRALQKMIEFVSTPEQIQTVIHALKDQVVPMIQDLNGNHVIQKCLNRLSSTDAQFIFDAVAAHCVVVGTHRHGCCVIQRCIDHASGHQKLQLVAAITAHSIPLVMDPFGNYVLQYIFDQSEETFSQPLCRTFIGEIFRLSKQKFSSNVVEKCLRIADNETKHRMIQEIIYCEDFEKMVDDPYANYVVQTAWDYAGPDDEALLAEKIRPVLPRMRHKPYGRRFQTRISERDKKLGIIHSGSMTPSSPDSMPFSPDSVTSSLHRHTMSQGSNIQNSSSHGYGVLAGYGQQSAGMNAAFTMPQQHRYSNPPLPNLNGYQGQVHVQQQYPNYGRQNQHHGMNYF